MARAGRANRPRPRADGHQDLDLQREANLARVARPRLEVYDGDERELACGEICKIKIKLKYLCKSVAISITNVAQIFTNEVQSITQQYEGQRSRVKGQRSKDKVAIYTHELRHDNSKI